MTKAKFSVGQRVGILVGLQAKGGPHVSQYGTVVDVVETWADVLEYVVEADDGTRLLYMAYLLTDAPDEREGRAYRAAGFFEQARAARDDVAAGAYPSLVPTVRAPIFRSGVFVGYAYGRIVANLAPSVRVNPPYLVELHNGGRVGAFSRELELA